MVDLAIPWGQGSAPDDGWWDGPGEQPVVESLVEQPQAYYRVKRAIDAALAGILLLALLPLLPFVALAILVETGRPVFFAQKRIGSRRVRENGEWVWRPEPFTFYKFRTMYVGRQESLHQDYMAAYIAGDESALGEYRSEEKAGPSYKLHEDRRVTVVGRFLRASSLDELPQLWNVLVGDMSLVGPRPPIPYEVAMYNASAMARFAATPGITGLWQVSGRSDLSFDEMIELDTDYIRRQSVGLDLKILLKTVPAVVSRKGAG